jgi:3-oxoacyl-[acyl-carrier protein] reductase
MQIKGSTVVITGGGRGIGREMAKSFAAQGANVALFDLNQADLDETARQCAAAGVTARGYLVNVTQESAVAAGMDAVVADFGGIDVLVNNAGIVKDGLLIKVKDGAVTGKMTLEQWQAVIDINLTGVFLTVRECVERMVNHDCRGLICLVSSTGSLGTAGQLNYSSSKAAMSVMPKVLTAEFFRRNIAEKIRCMAVAPGYVGTQMVKAIDDKVLGKIIEQVPIGRLIEPEEVVSLVAELYRNEAMAGETVFIHGGLRLGSKG